MTDAIDDMSHEVFVTYLAIPGLFSDDEIASKIRSYYPTADATERLEMAQVITKLKRPGYVTGQIRSAIRFTYGLPPVPGDDSSSRPPAP